VSVLRRAYIEVEPDLTGFDTSLTAKLRAADPGGKAGKQIGRQLNQSLARLNLPSIDIKANPAAAMTAIAATEERLRALSRDSATVEVKVQTERALGELARFKRQLGKNIGEDAGAEAATGFGAKFVARLGPVLANVPVGPVAAGAGVLGLAIAPSLAAGIGAGISGGVGVAAIAGGLYLVAKDPEIAIAGRRIGATFAAGLAAEAVTFRRPVLDSLALIETAAGQALPKIGQIFRNTSPAVTGLTRDVVTAGQAILDSFVVASSRSAAPMTALGHLIAAVGAEAGRTVATLSRDSQAGASAIDDLTNSMVNFVHGTTEFVHGLAQIKGGLDGFDHGIDQGRASVEDFINKLMGGNSALDLTADGYRRGSQAALLYRQGVIGAAGSVNDYNAYLKAAAGGTNNLTGSLTNAQRAARGERDALVGLSTELRKQADPVFALRDAQVKLKSAQDAAAEATRKHGRNSTEARAATRALALAALDMQARAGALGKTFSAQLTPQMMATLRAAGLTERQIADVAGEFRGAQRDATRFARRYDASVHTTGVPAVKAQLDSLLIRQQALKKGISVSAAASAYNKNAYAAGGPVYGPGTATSDSIPAMLSNNEHVWTAAEVKAAGGHQQVEALRRAAVANQLPPTFAAGGAVTWPFPATASKTRIPSRAEAMAAVTPAVPSGGGMTYPWIIKAAHALVGAVRVISTYRPGAVTLSGNRSYHAVGRAVDFAPSRTLARRWHDTYGPRTKEEISPWRQYDIRNGRPHYYSAPIHRQHSGGNAHVHIAMAGGGVIREPVLGVGLRSGSSYSFGERGTETVTPGGPGGDTFVFNFAHPVEGERAMRKLVVSAVKDAKRRNELP
jgi:hypothetical protein